MRGFLLASLFLFLCASMEAQMLCESPQGAYRECRVGTSGVLALVGELSEGRCVEGATWGTVSMGVSQTDCVLNHTWGYTKDGVWVEGGCSAEFAVAK
jgi:hypothetical protein